MYSRVISLKIVLGYSIINIVIVRDEVNRKIKLEHTVITPAKWWPICYVVHLIIFFNNDNFYIAPTLYDTLQRFTLKLLPSPFDE